MVRRLWSKPLESDVFPSAFARLEVSRLSLLSSPSDDAVTGSSKRKRRSIVVSGVVQGVGFRPFVYRLAHSLGIAGFVMNRAGEVHMEVEAERTQLELFVARLKLEQPPLARIESIHSAHLRCSGEVGFRIVESELTGCVQPFITPDVATCERCLTELFDPTDRRYRYPFLNCTDCGPRFSIVEAAPYDRSRTTMNAFALCEGCRSEYDDPQSRRFHAQPNACPTCGPELTFELGARRARGESALASAVEALKRGKILAIKGIGGFHLACDARNVSAVTELRSRKRREAKPFAVMVSNIAAALSVCEVSETECTQLAAPERPIVLLRQRNDSGIAEAVAPNSPFLGVMLAYTPLQHLLLADLADVPLVMTSGNVAHEPIAHEDADARERLAGIADGFLGNNRSIRLRSDDSVQRSPGSTAGPIIMRRSRGAAPRPFKLDHALPRPILALGPQTDVTFALGRDEHAFVSHHIGDLDHYAAYHAYCDAIGHYERLFGVEPEVVVHDLHPDYASTRLAHEFAQARGVERIAVQHHHAHIVSCMLENGLDEQVIGVAFDGSGYGTDGGLWGGEFLICDRGSAQRVAHFRPVPLPGGERAILEPWRMAAAYLWDAELPQHALNKRVTSTELAAVVRLLESRKFCPLTSSVGRLFDAVSAMCGVRLVSSYEGQAAIELEWAATGVTGQGSYAFDITQSDASVYVVDTRPLLRDVVRELTQGVSVSLIGRRFQHTLAEIVCRVCELLRAKFGHVRVVASGGVFSNAMLVTDLEALLPARGFEFHRPRAYPPNDGGLSLGQLAIAAELDRRSCGRSAV
jgi:hydrogenase maturation protein HypF